MKDSGSHCEVVITRTGAPAMLDRTTGEVMHPVVGPRVESERLYVSASRLAERLREPRPDPLVLLDVGLGAGSNAIAAWHVAHAAHDGSRRLQIVSFEQDLTAFSLALREDHAAAFGFEGEAGVAGTSILEHGRHESPRCSWRVVVGDLLQTLRHEPAASADVVFWDPFSPRANPALWTLRAFRALHRVCRAGATVHTYSAATSTRTALLLAGFAVGFGPCIGEKAHTTVAAMDAKDLVAPLDARWLERLRRSSAPLPADAPEDAVQQIQEAPQFRPA
jgi:queuine tRNA-ribosyltransferase